MKIILKILLLCVLVTTAPYSASANQLFVKKPGATAKPAPAQIPAPTNTPPAPKIPELEDPAQAAPEPMAPDATIDDFANRYYANCQAQQHPLLQGKNLELLCGCTASRLPEVMSVEQVQQMQEDSEEGQYQRNRMLLFVYAPCIEYPTRALILDQCLGDPQVQAGMKNFKTVCSCLADEMAAFMKEHAPGTIRNALRANQKDIDPLSTLLQSSAFDAASKSKMTECIALYELGQAKK
ncbi:MAG: hypothetical protein IT559_00735 [Alphaproteobacteria bacterium]|nr:hypothetical protein [Alphaproteobacteria bacterium]